MKNSGKNWTEYCLDLVMKGRYPDGYVCGNIKIVIEKIDNSRVEMSIYLVDPQTKRTLVNIAEVIVPEGDIVNIEPSAEVFSGQEHYLVQWPYNLDGVGRTGFPKLPSAFDSFINRLFKKGE